MRHEKSKKISKDRKRRYIFTAWHWAHCDAHALYLDAVDVPEGIEQDVYDEDCVYTRQDYLVQLHGGMEVAALRQVLLQQLDSIRHDYGPAAVPVFNGGVCFFTPGVAGKGQGIPFISGSHDDTRAGDPHPQFPDDKAPGRDRYLLGGHYPAVVRRFRHLPAQAVFPDHPGDPGRGCDHRRLRLLQDIPVHHTSAVQTGIGRPGRVCLHVFLE